MRSAFTALDIQFDRDMLDYLMFYVFKNSKNSQELRYQVMKKLIWPPEESQITESYDDDFDDPKKEQ